MKRTQYLFYIVAFSVIVFLVLLATLFLTSDPVERQGNLAISKVKHEIKVAGGYPEAYNWLAHAQAKGFLVAANQNIVWIVADNKVLAVGPKAANLTPQLKQVELELPQLKK